MRKPYQYAVAVNYDCSIGQRGHIISRHYTYAAAAAALRRNGYTTFLRIDNVPSGSPAARTIAEMLASSNI